MNGAAYLCLGTGTAAMSFGLVEPSVSYYMAGGGVLLFGTFVEEVTGE